MIVVDASALVEFLLQPPLGTRVEARLLRDGDELHSPHLVDVEVTQGLRRLVRSGEVSADRAAEAIADLVDLDGGVARRKARPVHRERVHPMGAPRVALDKALALAMTLEDEEIVREIGLRK